MENCCFCLEFQHHQVCTEVKEKYSVTNRILYEDEDFVILPSVSPIVEKHLLLLPKKHINTMKQLDNSEKERLLALINCTTQHFDEDYFIFEHGAFPVNGNTCGVDHAHIHILPVRKCISELIIAYIKKTYQAKFYMDFIFSLNDEKDKPYLLYGNSTHGIYSCNNAVFPSQFIRKLLCENLGIKEWNWRTFTNEHYFNIAISELRGRIHGKNSP